MKQITIASLLILGIALKASISHALSCSALSASDREMISTQWGYDVATHEDMATKVEDALEKMNAEIDARNNNTWTKDSRIRQAALLTSYFDVDGWVDGAISRLEKRDKKGQIENPEEMKLIERRRQEFSNLYASWFGVNYLSFASTKHDREVLAMHHPGISGLSSSEIEQIRKNPLKIIITEVQPYECRPEDQNIYRCGEPMWMLIGRASPTLTCKPEYLKKSARVDVFLRKDPVKGFVIFDFEVPSRSGSPQRLLPLLQSQIGNRRPDGNLRISIDKLFKGLEKKVGISPEEIAQAVPPQ